MITILEDTRNQIGKHVNINRQLEAIDGVRVERQGLGVGDYALSNSQQRVVDTKKDVLELISDVYHDHARFRRECQRAQDRGQELLVLVEEVLPGGKLANWRSPVYQRTTGAHRRGDPVSHADPSILRKALVTMTEKYGVIFRFCSKEETGRIIYDYLVEGVLP